MTASRHKPSESGAQHGICPDRCVEIHLDSIRASVT